MDGSRPHTGDVLVRLTRGLEAGVIGGIAMLAMLVSGSLLRGRVWWEVPNLLGTTFYGTRAFRSGVGMATVSGTALHMVITGTIGGLFGLACGWIVERRRLVLMGVLAGIVWYYLGDATFWNRVNPMVPLYSPPGVTLLAHMLFGACLGYMGQRQKLPEPAGESVVDEVE
jgi:hypothetical protein